MNKVVTILLLFFSLCAGAQEEYQPVWHSTMFGYGSANVYDTYLSPYNYKGTGGRIMRETWRQTSLMNNRIWVQTMCNLNAAYTSGPADNAHDWTGGIRYSVDWLYNLPVLQSSTSSLCLYAGLGISGYLGGVYNTRNGNNPANAHASVMIDASVMAAYDFRWLNRTQKVRYQLSVPMAGVAYSPNYGQSYYEEFMLGNSDHNICFAYVGNVPSWRHLLTWDITLNDRWAVRLGYDGEFMQSKLNGLRYHCYTHNFLIGFTKQFFRKGGRRK